MQQIIFFIQKYRYFLLFIFLEIIAIVLTIQTHSLHRSKFISATNRFTGSIYEKTNGFSELFILKKNNAQLSQENTRLKNLLAATTIKNSNSFLDSTHSLQKFTYTNAKVTKNNFRKKRNFIWINKGTKDGVTKGMGVINSNGIIGVTVDATKNYALILSILNIDSSINVKLKSKRHIGSLTWNGTHYKNVQLNDIPREAKIKIGDTIVSGGESNLFPEGIPIGVIKNFDFDRNFYENINVVLFNDMSAIEYVQIIQNLHKKELDSLNQYISNE